MEYETVSGGEVDISTERTLGLIGSILVLAGVILHNIGDLLFLLGIVLILIALYGIGTKLEDNRPFKYYLIGVIVLIVFVMVSFTLIGTAILISKPHSNSSAIDLFESRGTNTGLTHQELKNLPTGALGLMLVGLVLLFLGFVVGGYFQKKAWEAMYEITALGTFKDVARFLWWGVLTLIVVIGFILLLVAIVLQIIAFANLPKRLSKRSTPPAPTPVEELSW